MGQSHRQERVGEEIRKIIAEMLLREIKDPRLDRMISISACDVSPDLNYATCYITILSNEGEDPEEVKAVEEEVIKGFESCSGMIRKKIGHEMKLHRAPEFTWRIDESMEYGSKIDKLLASLDKE